MPDATFKELERVSERACVMLVSYRLPVVSNRDVCLFETSQQGKPWEERGSQQAAAACHTMFACSVEHPECPKRRGWVRAQLRVSVTIFEPTPEGGTLITSMQHSDPRGKVPVAAVNQMLVRGKQQLKDMRKAMVEGKL